MKQFFKDLDLQKEYENILNKEKKIEQLKEELKEDSNTFFKNLPKNSELYTNIFTLKDNRYCVITGIRSSVLVATITTFKIKDGKIVYIDDEVENLKNLLLKCELPKDKNVIELITNRLKEEEIQKTKYNLTEKTAQDLREYMEKHDLDERPVKIKSLEKYSRNKFFGLSGNPWDTDFQLEFGVINVNTDYFSTETDDVYKFSEEVIFNKKMARKLPIPIRLILTNNYGYEEYSEYATVSKMDFDHDDNYLIIVIEDIDNLEFN